MSGASLRGCGRAETRDDKCLAVPKTTLCGKDCVNSAKLANTLPNILVGE